MFTIMELSYVCKGKLLYNNNRNIDYFSINSKDINNNTLFIPLKGKNKDAHNYIDEVIKNKVTACLISKKYKYYKNIIKKLIENKISVILVNDTFISLIKLAKYNRYKNYDTFVIAITGSNGKTSTKDLIYDVLKNDYNVLKTKDNLNNIIGVCKTMLNLNKHDILVIELGMNHKNEISKLSKIVKPNISIITNIGSAHIGLLGSIKNIIKAKMEILDGMDEKVLYVNSNNYYLNNIDYDNNIKLYKYNYDYIIYKKHYYYLFYNKIKIKVNNNVNPNNVIIAYLMAKRFEISDINIKKYILKHKVPKMRMEIINNIICDCYNSNYESFINGINYTINNYKDKRIILIIGDILELGKYSKYYHELLGKYINKISSNIYKVYLVGNEVKYTYDTIIGIKKEIYNSVEEIENIFKEKNALYYIKGSRKIGLDKLIENI